MAAHRVALGGISFEVSDRLYEERVAVYTAPAPGPVLSVMYRPEGRAPALLADKLRLVARMEEDFELVKSRELEVAGRPGAEAEMTYRGTAGPATEHVLFVEKDGGAYVFDLAFSGPRAEREKVGILFAHMARTVQL